MTNTYDNTDMVRRVFLMNAGGLKFASYRVRAMPGGPFSSLQHHLTHVPVTDMGFLSGDGGPKHVLVNEIGATVYATLDDAFVGHLEVALKAATERTAGGEMGDGRSKLDVMADAGVINHFDDEKWISVYRLPPTDKNPVGKIEFQMGSGLTVLGLLTQNLAEMFCTLARQARDGAPSLAGRANSFTSNDHARVEKIAGAVTHPGETIANIDKD